MLETYVYTMITIGMVGNVMVFSGCFANWPTVARIGGVLTLTFALMLLTLYLF